MEIKNPFTVADFFAGIGLVTLGFHRSGWKVEYAVDYSSDKMEMYAQNFDGSHYELRDILEVAGEEVPDVTLAHASFPCTDVSVAGGRNGLNGEASSQIWSFIRILSEMNGRRPPLILLENVEGFLTSHGGDDLHVTVDALGDLGYSMDPLLIDASNFVPQSRVRLLIVGTRQKAQSHDEIEEILSNNHECRPEKVARFIREHPNLPWRLRSLPPLPERSADLKDIVDESADWWSRDRADYLYNQMFRRHQKWIDKHKNAAKYHYATAFRRMRERDGKRRSTAEIRTDGIAGCLRTPKGGSARQIIIRAGKGRYDARLLNGRECARLMGADDYSIDPSLPLTQVLFGFGDAVCVPAIEWLVREYITPLTQKMDASTNDAETPGKTVKGQLTEEKLGELSIAQVAACRSFREWCKENRDTQNDINLPFRGRSYAALVTLDRLLKDYNLDVEAHKTPSGSSVSRVTIPNVRRILSEFDERRPLTSEAGRTSRGTLHAVESLLMRLKKAKLENLPDEERLETIRLMMAHLVWVAGEYHERARIEVDFNPSMSANQVIGSILEVAVRDNKAGAVAQHLVGAKLEIRFPDKKIDNYSFSTADVQTKRRGDFEIGDYVFHVTVAAPSDKLYRKVQSDLNNGFGVYILVPQDIASGTEEIAHARVSPKIEVQSIEKFVGQNLNEIGGFSKGGFRNTLLEVLRAYNRRVREVEADTALLIDIPDALTDEDES